MTTKTLSASAATTALFGLLVATTIAIKRCSAAPPLLHIYHDSFAGGRDSRFRHVDDINEVKRYNTYIRRLQDDDSASCIEENELLRYAGVLADPIDFSDGDLFFIDEATAVNKKTFSTWNNDCTEDEISGVCDYSTLVEQLTMGCNLFGGKMYEISGTETCRTSFTDPNSPTKEYTYKNWPVCIGKSCSIEPRVTFHAALSEIDCTNQNFVANPVDQKITDECQQDQLDLIKTKPEDMDSFFSPMSGIGGVNYIWEYEDGVWTDQHCVYETLTSTCDFTPIHATLQSMCESQDSYLFAFSDLFYELETNSTMILAGDGVTMIPLTSEHTGTYNHQPICIASSCTTGGADVGVSYIRDVLVDYLTFVFNGTFIDNSGGAYGNSTMDRTYSLLDGDNSIVAVSDVPVHNADEPGEGGGDDTGTGTDTDSTPDDGGDDSEEPSEQSSGEEGDGFGPTPPASTAVSSPMFVGDFYYLWHLLVVAVGSAAACVLATA